MTLGFRSFCSLAIALFLASAVASAAIGDQGADGKKAKSKKSPKIVLGATAPKFTLPDLKGRKHRSQDVFGRKVTLLILMDGLAEEKNYPALKRITNMRKRFSRKSLAIVVVDFSPRWVSERWLAKFYKKIKADIVLRDSNSKIIPLYEVTTQSKSFLLNNRHIIRYLGPVPDLKPKSDGAILP